MLTPSLKYYLTTVPAIIATLLFMSGCGGIEKLDSTWRDREVTIDGVTDEDEWDSARYIYEEPDFTLGVMNDKDFIYLSLATSDDAMVKKISRYGFTVWFNETGKKDKILGFQFPVGRSVKMMALRHDGRGQGENDGDMPPGRDDPSGDQDNLERRRPMRPFDREHKLDEQFSQCAILKTETKTITPMSTQQAAERGIEAVLKIENGLLVYELKFPLVTSEETPFAVGNGTSGTIGIGSTTGAMEQRANRGGNRGGGSRGGMSGGMGGMGGMGGDMNGGMGGMGGMGGGMNGGMGRGGGQGGVPSGMGGQDAAMSQATEVWFKTELKTSSE